jgi:hypothetical protein
MTTTPKYTVTVHFDPISFEFDPSTHEPFQPSGKGDNKSVDGDDLLDSNDPEVVREYLTQWIDDNNGVGDLTEDTPTVDNIQVAKKD